MNPQWKEFLAARAARIEHGTVQGFAGSAPWRGDGATLLCDRSHLGMITAAGADADKFLQGQLTSDLRTLTHANTRLGGYCTPQGRLLAVLRLFRRAETVCLELPRPLLEPVRARLRRYVLRAKVRLEDHSDTVARIGVAGPRAAALLQEHLPEVPAGVDDAVTAGGVTVLRLPGPWPRFQLLGEAATLQTLWPPLAEQSVTAGPDPWTWLDVQAGLPVIHDATSEAFVPQMVNLHRVGGLSFDKGCYAGQEVVARTQYLGKLKRHMRLAHLDAAAAPAPGDGLYEHGQNGQSVGKVVAAAPNPTGGHDLLAVVRLGADTGGGLRLGGPHGPALALRDLPYAPDADQPDP